jgi:hypothetical protein
MSEDDDTFQSGSHNLSIQASRLSFGTETQPAVERAGRQDREKQEQ